MVRFLSKELANGYITSLLRSKPLQKLSDSRRTQTMYNRTSALFHHNSASTQAKQSFVVTARRGRVGRATLAIVIVRASVGVAVIIAAVG